MRVRSASALATVLFLALTAASAAEGDAWSRLKVGDWAKYKTVPAPGVEAHQKWTVTEVTDDKVVYSIETTTMMNGVAVSPPVKTEMTYDKTAMRAMAPGDAAVVSTDGSVTTSDETVTVHGKELKVRLVTAEGETAGQKYSSKSWISDEVPFGIVKSEANGVVALELVEWGSGS